MRHLIGSKISLLGRPPAATTQPCNYFFSWTSSTALLSRCSASLQQPSSPVSAADPQQLPPPSLMLPEIKGRATGTSMNHLFNSLMKNHGGSCPVVVRDDDHGLSCSHGWVPFASLGDCGVYPFPSLPNLKANVIPKESDAAESMENFVNWTQSFPVPQLPLESTEPNLPEDILSRPTLSDLQLMEEEGIDDAALLTEALMGTSLAKICFELASKVYPKHHRGRMKGTSHQGNEVSFGRFGLQALESSWITARQIEAGRRAMVRNAPRSAKIWVRVFPDKPVTAKPTEVRMGKGKGAPSHMVAVVKPGRILYEIGLVAETTARKAVEIAASKLPIQSRFVISA